MRLTFQQVKMLVLLFEDDHKRWVIPFTTDELDALEVLVKLKFAKRNKLDRIKFRITHRGELRLLDPESLCR